MAHGTFRAVGRRAMCSLFYESPADFLMPKRHQTGAATGSRRGSGDPQPVGAENWGAPPGAYGPVPKVGRFRPRRWKIPKDEDVPRTALDDRWWPLASAVPIPNFAPRQEARRLTIDLLCDFFALPPLLRRQVLQGFLLRVDGWPSIWPLRSWVTE